jgi:hypothetical protein
MNADLEGYAEHLKTNKFTSSELWTMRYGKNSNFQSLKLIFSAVMSNLHPETGKPIFPTFRWSAFAPMNIPIIVMLAILPPTTMNQVIGQSLNQTLNFGVNVANASASNTMNLQEIGRKCFIPS